MTMIRRIGLSACFALLLLGGWASCSQSDTAGILLTVDKDNTVPNSPAITSVAVTVNGTTKRYDVSTGLPGTLGIKTGPGDKIVLVVGYADATPVASGTTTCSATAGKVLECSVTLSVLVTDAGISSDARASDTGGAPGADGATNLDVPTGLGGASGGYGGTIASGGASGGTATGGVSTVGGSTSSGGATGAASDAGADRPGPDANPTTDAPTDTAGSSGGAGGVIGGATGSGGRSSTGGTISGSTSTGGSTTIGGTTSSGAGTASAGTSGSAGTTSSGGAAGGSTKLVATMVATGSAHTCALISDGTIRCWGNNSDGQLGNGDTRVDDKSTVYSSSPVQVLGVTEAIAIGVGDYHSCAVLKGGKVQCWGWNDLGQLGDGDTSSARFSTTPLNVVDSSGTAITGAVSVVGGKEHSCAILPGNAGQNTVACWGANTVGQLGAGTGAPSYSPTPLPVVAGASETPLSGATALAAYGYNGCAVVAGSVYCWGDNSRGQLGTGDNSSTEVAVKAGITGTVAGVGTGGDQSCALGAASGGSPYNVVCWGTDSSGEIGAGPRDGGNEVFTPVHALVSANATMLALGSSHSCAVLADKTVQCWGYNSDGQLGNNAVQDSSVPVAAGNLSQVISLSAGAYHTCAVATGGAVYCWGSNSLGQLGRAGGLSRVPALVPGFGP